MDMRVNIAGVEWKNPVTVASGTFGSGEEFSEFVDLNKLGAVTTKEDCVYLLMNPYWEGVWIELPQLPGGYSWHVAVNTGDKKQEIYQNPVRISEERILVGPRSVIVLEADQQ